MSKKRIIYSLSFENCLDNSKNVIQKDLALANKTLIETIRDDSENIPEEVAINLIQADYKNSNTVKYSKHLLELQNLFRTKLRDNATCDSDNTVFSIEEQASNLPNTNQQNIGNWRSTNNKIFLLIQQMHYFAEQYPDDVIHFKFLDNQDTSPLTNEVIPFLKNHANTFIPPNVTLEICHYNGGNYKILSTLKNEKKLTHNAYSDTAKKLINGEMTLEKAQPKKDLFAIHSNLNNLFTQPNSTIQEKSNLDNSDKSSDDAEPIISIEPLQQESPQPPEEQKLESSEESSSNDSGAPLVEEVPQLIEYQQPNIINDWNAQDTLIDIEDLYLLVNRSKQNKRDTPDYTLPHAITFPRIIELLNYEKFEASKNKDISKLLLETFFSINQTKAGLTYDNTDEGLLLLCFIPKDHINLHMKNISKNSKQLIENCVNQFFANSLVEQTTAIHHYDLGKSELHASATGEQRKLQAISDSTTSTSQITTYGKDAHRYDISKVYILNIIKRQLKETFTNNDFNRINFIIRIVNSELIAEGGFVDSCTLKNPKARKQWLSFRQNCINLLDELQVIINIPPAAQLYIATSILEEPSLAAYPHIVNNLQQTLSTNFEFAAVQKQRFFDILVLDQKMKMTSTTNSNLKTYINQYTASFLNILGANAFSQFLLVVPESIFTDRVEELYAGITDHPRLTANQKTYFMHIAQMIIRFQENDENKKLPFIGFLGLLKHSGNYEEMFTLIDQTQQAFIDAQNFFGVENPAIKTLNSYWSNIPQYFLMTFQKIDPKITALVKKLTTDQENSPLQEFNNAIQLISATFFKQNVLTGQYVTLLNQCTDSNFKAPLSFSSYFSVPPLSSISLSLDSNTTEEAKWNAWVQWQKRFTDYVENELTPQDHVFNIMRIDIISDMLQDYAKKNKCRENHSIYHLIKKISSFKDHLVFIKQLAQTGSFTHLAQKINELETKITLMHTLFKIKQEINASSSRLNFLSTHSKNKGQLVAIIDDFIMNKKYKKDLIHSSLEIVKLLIKTEILNNLKKFKIEESKSVKELEKLVERSQYSMKP